MTEKGFSELNLEELKVLASNWAQEHDVIEKITLYRGYYDSGARYVFVVTAAPFPDEEARKKLQSDTSILAQGENILVVKTIDYYNWAMPDCLQIEDDLKSAYKDLEHAPEFIRDEWIWFPIKPGGEIPHDLVNDNFLVTLYEKFKQKSNLTPNQEDKKACQEIAKKRWDEYYQQLNLTELKVMAQGWANRFSVIKQITLYRADRDGKYVLDVRIDDSDKIEYRYFEEYWIDKDCYLDGLRDVYKEPTEPHGDWLFYSLVEVGGEPLSKDNWVLTDSRLILFPRDDVDEAALWEPQKNANVFHLYGDNWKVNYKGDETSLRNLERVRYVVYLLESPAKGFYPIDLTMLVKGNRPNTNKDYSTMGKEQLEEERLSLADLPLEKLSEDDKSKLEDIIYKCWATLNEAKKRNNEKQIKEAEKHWDSTRSHLLNEYGVKIIDTSTGLKFKFLNRLKDDQEKARSNVTKHIKNAISDIKKKLPSLGKHLDKHIKTGLKCSYGVDPETLPIWDIHWNN